MALFAWTWVMKVIMTLAFMILITTSILTNFYDMASEKELIFSRKLHPFGLRGRSLQGPFGPGFDPHGPHGPFDPNGGGSSTSSSTSEPKSTRNPKTGSHSHTPCTTHCVKGLPGPPSQ